MELRTSILKALAYFDLFSYPLTIGDLRYFLDTDAEEAEIRRETQALIREGCLFRLGPFFSLHNNPALVEKRRKGERHADELLQTAARGARLLYQFPFVRGVCISGSLSKRCADEKADIDYFIITRSGRLWIARTLMHLFKKLTYMRGHQHHYCLNYYVDEDALEIREKNIFTAIELLTLMPACGNGGLAKFFQANSWTTMYLPHYRNRRREGEGSHRPSQMKRFFEWGLSNRLGDRIDNLLRRITDGRWKKKTERGDRNMKGDVMALQCGKHYSRPNPEIFQQKVLSRYHRKLKEIAARWGEPV
jgi:hypothetical protein